MEAVIGDWRRYLGNPKYRSQIGKVTKALLAAPDWYAQGKVRPHVSSTVPFETKTLHQAIADVGQGKGVDKVVLKVR